LLLLGFGFLGRWEGGCFCSGLPEAVVSLLFWKLLVEFQQLVVLGLLVLGVILTLFVGQGDVGVVNLIHLDHWFLCE
jgi:hypothetical protein